MTSLLRMEPLRCGDTFLRVDTLPIAVGSTVLPWALAFRVRRFERVLLRPNISSTEADVLHISTTF